MAQVDEATPLEDDEDDETLEGELALFRRSRRALERAVRPNATSVDGRRFSFQASLYDLEIRTGGYVALDDGEESRLGLVTDLRAETVSAAGQARSGTTVRIMLAAGEGIVLSSSGGPFHEVAVRPAPHESVAAWARSVSEARKPRAGLLVGELQQAPGVGAELDSAGFTRHTFLCGQSGSGKTYSLGVVLERLLVETSLRLVILDPNSDYVGLGQVRPDADPAMAERYRPVAGDVVVWGGPGADRGLHLQFADLDPAAQAAVLDLDPVTDRDEYAALLELLERQVEGRPLVSGPEDLLGSEADADRRLGLRAKNLGVLNWSVWSPTQPSLVRELRAPTARCTVVDLGSLAEPDEQRLVTQAVLSTLWDGRAARSPVLVVMDEAHNICPARTDHPLVRLSAARAVQIAGEGRKYGLYLLTSTQRPHKLHEDVVSQCDNLVLMRMNSEADLDQIARQFSFVPQGLVRGASGFRQGEALVGGRIFPQPAYLRMGERVTREGGSDVPTTWAHS